MGILITIGRVLTAWFNDCILVMSGQIANPIIAIVDPVLLLFMFMFMFARLLIVNVGKLAIFN